MHAAAVTTPPATKASKSKFSVQKAATPQGTKRNVVETVPKGQASEVPKASKVTCTPRPSRVYVRVNVSLFLSSGGISR